MAYTRTYTVDASPGGDTTKAAVATKLETDLTDIYTHLTSHEALTTGIHGVGSGTVVGSATTETLTNKTLSAPTLTGAVTMSGATLTGGNSVNMTLTTPTLTGTIPASGATLSSPSITGGTATNLTLATPTITGTVTASGATISSPAITGATITNSTLNGLTHTAATTGFTIAGGTSSKTLTVTGDATISGTPTIGGITTIASGSLPAAAVLDIINIPATYAYLVLQITGASCDTTSRYLLARISTDNGSSFKSTGYSGYRYTASAVADTTNMVSATSNSVPTDLHTATLVISAYHGGVNAKYVSRVNHTNSTDINITEGFFTDGTDAINAIRIMWNGAGSFDAGTYALYGVS